MKVLLDTSVLVAAMVEAHPHHELGFRCLRRVVQGEVNGMIAAHTLAELYAILTTLPVTPRISSADAVTLIQRNVLTYLEVVSLEAHEYMQVLEQLADKGLIGGVTYDAIILQAAKKANVDWVITFNVKDFKRVFPDMVDKIIAPTTLV